MYNNSWGAPTPHQHGIISDLPLLGSYSILQHTNKRHKSTTQPHISFTDTDGCCHSLRPAQPPLSRFTDPPTAGGSPSQSHLPPHSIKAHKVRTFQRPYFFVPAHVGGFRSSQGRLSGRRLSSLRDVGGERAEATWGVRNCVIWWNTSRQKLDCC